MQMTNQPPTNTMKAATDMTEKQLISWLRKTEATGNRELYRSGMSSNYELLRAQN
jgi:hypothetical protein